MKLFTEHPNTQNETYIDHAKFALRVGVRLFISSMWLVVHAVFPFIQPPKPYDIASIKDFMDRAVLLRDLDG